MINYKIIEDKNFDDGTKIAAAVKAYYKDKTGGNVVYVLSAVAGNKVWIAYRDSQTGDSVALKTTSKVTPELLRNGDEWFLPIFSSEAAMGEFGTHFSKKQVDIVEVINMARNNEKKIACIALNVFSETFFLNEEVWQLMERMLEPFEDD